MTYIPNGSILTWVGSWVPGVTFTGTINDVINQVSVQLNQLGLKVISSNTPNAGLFNLGQDPVTSTIVVQTNSGVGYASENDVQSIVDHAIYQASGSLPNSSNITNVQLAGAGTGPSVTNPPAPCQSGLLGTLLSWVGGCTQPASQQGSSGGFSLSSLTSSGVLYLGLAVFGFVAALALIGYSGALKRSAA